MNTRTWLICGIAALCVPLSGCASVEEAAKSADAPTESTDAPATKDAKKAKAKKAKSCGTKATDDCTPHVAASGKVRVDALTWEVTSAKSAATLGDMTYGLGEKANGRFVVVKLDVHSDRSESATLTSDAVKLKIGGRTYSSDNDGTFAAMGAGEEPFLFEDIGPDSDISGVVVFDVPANKFSKKMELRFGELGFGSTEGFIALKKLKS